MTRRPVLATVTVLCTLAITMGCSATRTTRTIATISPSAVAARSAAPLIVTAPSRRAVPTRPSQTALPSRRTTPIATAAPTRAWVPASARPLAPVTVSAPGVRVEPGKVTVNLPAMPAPAATPVRRPVRKPVGPFTIRSVRDISQLPDAHGLRRFARSQLAAATAQNGCRMALTVDRLDPESSAAVGWSGCGGYRAIWGMSSGEWREVYAGQAPPACAGLKATGASLNAAVVGRCITTTGALQPYHP